MAKKPKLLSHDEIWDDSGIVESWNEALEEYKLYHSIHAKGERVEDVIEHFKAHEDLDNELLEDNLTTSVNGAEQSLATDEVVEDGVWEQEQEEMQDDEHITHEQGESSDTILQEPSSDVTAGPAAQAAVPVAMIGTIQDESLKNLMMSWYWAGYYTGYQQGQQQSLAQQADKR